MHGPVKYCDEMYTLITLIIIIQHINKFRVKYQPYL